MDMRIQNALHATLLKLLRPLARVMLSHGMSHGAFAELSRQAFVEEGFNHVARAGKRPTISGVAAVTGLSRKEVKRLNELDPEALTASSQRRNRAIRVLSGWVNDPQFQHEGQPAVLQLDGRESSFAELVKRYGGDVPTMAMLSLLCDSGSVMADQDRVTLLKKAYIPMATPLDRLNILGTDAGELISTIGHNMMAAPADRLFQRKVSNALVRKDALPEFREMSNRRSQELLEEYDAWLSEREVSDTRADQNEAAYVAVGIYYVEHSDEEASP